MQIHLPAVLILLTVGACSDPAGVSAPLPPNGPLLVQLQTDHAAYQLAGNALITMTNATSDTVLFGGCEDALERQVGATWVGIAPLTYPCPSVALSIAPSDSLTLPLDLRTATVPGTYRFRRPFWPLNGAHADRSYRRSNSFQLLP